MPLLSWCVSDEINTKSGFIYLVRVVDAEGNEYRYVGKAKNESRLHEYKNNMIKIAEGRRRAAKQRYRAVHFVLAKALEQGWRYEIAPIENASTDQLLARERYHKQRLACNLNGARTWEVNQFTALSVHELLRQPR
jgi:hypothetical protein